jgi:hypothetical protein
LLAAVSARAADIPRVSPPATISLIQQSPRPGTGSVVVNGVGSPVQSAAAVGPIRAKAALDFSEVRRPTFVILSEAKDLKIRTARNRRSFAVCAAQDDVKEVSVEHNDNYERLIAQIDQAIAQAGERVSGLANNVNRAINVLTSSHPNGLPKEERGVLLAFEALCVESLWRTAWLLHARREHDQARHCLEVGRMLQTAVDEATRS